MPALHNLYRNQYRKPPKHRKPRRISLAVTGAAAAIAHYFGVFQRSSVSRAATVYYCPMHPSVVQDQPGECPICSMTLVPKDNAKTAEKMGPVGEGLAIEARAVCLLFRP